MDATFDYLNPKQAAAYLSLSVSFLAHLRVRGDGPPFIRFSRQVILYKRDDLVAWLDARRVRSTSEESAAA